MAAAMALVGLGGAGIVYMLTPTSPSVASGAVSFATRANETATVTLTDGSFVRLAPNSTLRLSPAANDRQVWLEGRAFFAVQSDSIRPFRVQTRGGDALALGTRFELRTDDRDLRLTVVEGRVALEVGRERVDVDAGEVSHVREGLAPSVVQVDDIAALLDWPGGLLIFKRTPLAQVARELERHFGVPFTVADAATASRQVTAWFTDERLDEVVIAICRATVTRCAIEENGVVLGERRTPRVADESKHSDDTVSLPAKELE